MAGTRDHNVYRRASATGHLGSVAVAVIGTAAKTATVLRASLCDVRHNGMIVYCVSGFVGVVGSSDAASRAIRSTVRG